LVHKVEAVGPALVPFLPYLPEWSRAWNTGNWLRPNISVSSAGAVIDATPRGSARHHPGFWIGIRRAQKGCQGRLGKEH